MNNKLPTYGVNSPTSTPTRPEYTVAAATAPGLDELLDSLHPRAAITRMERDSRHKWHITIQFVTVPDTSPVLHTFIGAGPTRMDAIHNAVAQATTTQEGTSDE